MTAGKSSICCESSLCVSILTFFPRCEKKIDEHLEKKSIAISRKYIIDCCEYRQCQDHILALVLVFLFGILLCNIYKGEVEDHLLTVLGNRIKKFR